MCSEYSYFIEQRRVDTCTPLVLARMNEHWTLQYSMDYLLLQTPVSQRLVCAIEAGREAECWGFVLCSGGRVICEDISCGKEPVAIPVINDVDNTQVRCKAPRRACRP